MVCEQNLAHNPKVDHVRSSPSTRPDGAPKTPPPVLTGLNVTCLYSSDCWQTGVLYEISTGD